MSQRLVTLMMNLFTSLVRGKKGVCNYSQQNYNFLKLLLRILSHKLFSILENFSQGYRLKEAK